jgi:Xaa-Pro aminopeptidase
MPVIPAEVYVERLDRLRRRMAERGLDRLVVYADREHSANISYLTGFDPRFEEAILVVGSDDEPAILVGNECWGMAGAAPVAMRRHLLQDLSLPSQPRDRSKPLGDILADEGITAGSRVGVVGWKIFGDGVSIELPYFIVAELQRLTGRDALVESATDRSSGPPMGCASSTRSSSSPTTSGRPHTPPAQCVVSSRGSCRG